jgi:hypothetical protein
MSSDVCGGCVNKDCLQKREGMGFCMINAIFNYRHRINFALNPMSLGEREGDPITNEQLRNKMIYLDKKGKEKKVSKYGQNGL